jgi:hypothetical protein
MFLGVKSWSGNLCEDLECNGFEISDVIVLLGFI